jgi:hypothetical protein
MRDVSMNYSSESATQTQAYDGNLKPRVLHLDVAQRRTRAAQTFACFGQLRHGAISLATYRMLPRLWF